VKAAEPAKPGFGTQVLRSLFRDSAIRLTPSGLNFSGVLDHVRVDGTTDFGAAYVTNMPAAQFKAAASG